MSDHVRVAVLLDCENISYRLAGAVLAETTKHGTLTVKRGYGDWASAYLSGWRKTLPLFAIQPVQQFSYAAGKNSSDAALIVDAMDLLYAGNVDVFCIVSGDSDFTRLVTRVRESGRKVYGMGSRSTHPSFVNAFDRFTFTEVLGCDALIPAPDEAEAGGEVPELISKDLISASAVYLEDPSPLPELKAVVTRAILASVKDDGWAVLATVGWYIVNNIPSFDSRNYGHPKLGGLIRSLPYVDVRDKEDGRGGMQLQVRLHEGA
jgi:uncharacterized protein (TIGR00288 family)